MKQKKMKEIESSREEIERQLMSLESYKKYVYYRCNFISYEISEEARKYEIITECPSFSTCATFESLKWCK